MESYVLSQWADELSEALGRSAEDILQRGLSARDFRSDEELKIRFPDGSSAHFKFAFLLHSPARNLLAVFTEHCGYHVFPARGIAVERIRQEWFGV